MDRGKLKDINIVDFFKLHSVLQYERKLGNEYYFKKNGQKTGSISVNAAKQFFYDHSIGGGGNIYTAYDLFYNGTSQLENYVKVNAVAVENVVTILSVKAVSNELLKRFYCKERNLDLKYLHLLLEIKYRFNNKVFFTLGWKNCNGGYNTQNALFKRVIDCGGPTIIHNKLKPHKAVCFEAYFDYLAYLSHTGDIDSDTIILNSTSFAKYPFELANYKIVKCYFDNDEAGDKATAYFVATYGNAVDSRFYSCNDYNDFIRL